MYVYFQIAVPLLLFQFGILWHYIKPISTLTSGGSSVLLEML